jgi:ribosome biogenesis GTPase / thiamine phosphate phosphatase
MSEIVKGTVVKSTGSIYVVNTDKEQLNCRIKGKFRLKGTRTTNPVAVGDKVEVELLVDEPGSGVIVGIKERLNYIIRKSTNLSKESQIMAANIDQAILIATIRFPETTAEFIDRFLMTAEAYRIKAIIIINKIDLFDQIDQEIADEWTEIYQKIGYPCLNVSIEKNLNIDQIKNILKDKVTLLAGNSGVGKSSMINAIDPTLNLKTGSISDYHKQGKHTTTFAEMHTLSMGGYIIDSPGIRGFGLIDMEKDELSHFFPEIFKKSAECKFYNCTHIHEPGCAVLEAIETGEISYSRYRSYFNTFNEDNAKYRSKL